MKKLWLLGILRLLCLLSLPLHWLLHFWESVTALAAAHWLSPLIHLGGVLAECAALAGGRAQPTAALTAVLAEKLAAVAAALVERLPVVAAVLALPAFKMC